MFLCSYAPCSSLWPAAKIKAPRKTKIPLRFHERDLFQGLQAKPKSEYRPIIQEAIKNNENITTTDPILESTEDNADLVNNITTKYPLLNKQKSTRSRAKRRGSSKKSSEQREPAVHNSKEEKEKESRFLAPWRALKSNLAGINGKNLRDKLKAEGVNKISGAR